MPMGQNESLEEFEARLKATWERGQEPPAPKQAKDMTEAEREAALAVLLQPKLYENPLPPELAGKRVEDMDEREKRRSASALGISHLL